MNILNNRRYRYYLYQVIAVVSSILVIWYAGSNAFSNLEKQGIATGFSFLGHPSGFDIIMHLVPFNEDSPYSQALFVGLINTVIVSLAGIILATIIGFIVGIGRLSDNLIVKIISSTYIELFRNIPLLLQIFFWYFAVLRLLPSPRKSLELAPNVFLNIRGLYIPHVSTGAMGLLFISLSILFCLVASRIIYKRIIGYRIKAILFLIVIFVTAASIFFIINQPNLLQVSYPKLKGFNFRGGMVIIPEFIAMLLALSIYTAAFIAEIIRAGILAVDKGQTEAALSLGLSKSQTLRLIIIPQALRVIIPPLNSQYMNLTKNSSLGAAIAYPELVSVFAGTVLNQTGQAIEVIAITMSFYLGLSLLISMLMNWYNHKIKLVGG